MVTGWDDVEIHSGQWLFDFIVVAILGVFLAAGLGLLDYNLVWVNPTYLRPGSTPLSS